MNKNQKIVAGIALAFLVGTLIWAPFKIFNSDHHLVNNVNAAIWDAPFHGELNVPVLLCEWVAIAAAATVLYFMFKPKRAD